MTVINQLYTTFTKCEEIFLLGFNEFNPNSPNMDEESDIALEL
jgi:hypothetical protein